MAEAGQIFIVIEKIGFLLQKGQEAPAQGLAQESGSTFLQENVLGKAPQSLSVYLHHFVYEQVLVQEALAGKTHLVQSGQGLTEILGQGKSLVLPQVVHLVQALALYVFHDDVRHTAEHIIVVAGQVELGHGYGSLEHLIELLFLP
ncbi:MAG TPA: hypothetical protein PKE54_08285 [Candidatus Obscuribacter sp.]|nr:hypothetical protein [Candidatus Obscuribacter sp.]